MVPVTGAMNVVVPRLVVPVVSVTIDLGRVVIKMRRVVVPTVMTAVVPVIVAISLCAIAKASRRMAVHAIRRVVVATSVNVTTVHATTVEAKTTDLNTNLCLRLVRVTHQQESSCDHWKRQ